MTEFNVGDIVIPVEPITVKSVRYFTKAGLSTVREEAYLINVDVGHIPKVYKPNQLTLVKAAEPAIPPLGQVRILKGYIGQSKAAIWIHVGDHRFITKSGESRIFDAGDYAVTEVINQ